MSATHEVDPELEAERAVKLFQKMFANFQRTDALVLDVTEGTAATGSDYIKLRLELPNRERIFAYWFAWGRDTAPNPDSDCRIMKGVGQAEKLIAKNVRLVYTVNNKGFTVIEALILRSKTMRASSKKKTTGRTARVT
jgi:hypothetical protein